MLNKPTKFKLKTLLTAVLITSMIVFTVVSISHLESKSKYLKSNNNILVDSKLLECYDSCSDINSSTYKSLSADYLSFIEQLELAKQEEVEKDRLAEIARVEELAKIEAERLHKIELEKERLKRIEEKKNKAKVASRSNAKESFGQWIQFEATYYGSNCYKCSGITALGINVRNTIYHNGLRIVAVDPKVIPLGSIVEVKTPNETFKAIAGDTGGRIKNHIIDILVESEAVSSEYGRHPVQVRILK